jgi:hypothetical protein
MTGTTADSLFKGSTARNTRGLLRITILCLVAAAAIASRLFSVIRTYASSQLETLQRCLLCASIDSSANVQKLVTTGSLSVLLLT